MRFERERAVILQLRKAQGPDRALDRMIRNIINPILIGRYKQSRVPQYTGDLGDARKLVPKEFDWIVGDINGHFGGTPYACVGSTLERFGATAELSLCIAAMMAIIGAEKEELEPLR